MKISNENLQWVKKEVENTQHLPLKNIEEERRVNPGPYSPNTFGRNKAYSIEYYSRKKSPLTDFIDKLSGRDYTDMNSLHKVTYFSGNGIKPHTDNSDCTLVLILNRSHTAGGEFLMNGVEQPNFTNPGDYIIYDGGITVHEVLPVLGGDREVLVATYLREVKELSTVNRLI